MKKNLRAWVAILAAICSMQLSHAQYYSWGSDPAKFKWYSIQSDDRKVIYPDSTDYIARQTMHYLEALRPSLSVGFERPAVEFPIVVHPQNFASNGLVMWAPKRIEFLSTPDTDNYSSLWIKHLTAHEYRHVVQYSNINQGFVKAGYYLFGQQLLALSLALVPTYGIEGDAVMFETQTSSYGRALQPNFTLGYRAMGKELTDPRWRDRWFCGSYKVHVPDHYEFGYQMTAYAYKRYGENIWNRMAEYAARNTYVIFTTSRTLKKFYNTSENQLFDETFSDLQNFWAQLPQADDRSKILSTQTEENYTTYSHPMVMENGRILALKSDYDNPPCFVIFDPQTYSEEEIRHTGTSSSRPDYADGRVWWSEYSRSMLFAQRVDSKIRYMDLEDEKIHTLKGVDNALYITPIANSKDHIAYVAYELSGRYSIVEMEGKSEISRTYVDRPCEVHGLTWDDKTEALYAIITDDNGMNISRVQGGDIKPITQSAYITISNLRAKNGKLYFGSIASGKDQIHSLDIATGKQLQITDVQYGAFSPSTPNADNQIYITSYNKLGYHLATQAVDAAPKVIKPSRLPKNVVNPEHVKLDVINIDSVKFTQVDLEESEQKIASKKYRKSTHLFNVHSWAPVRFNPLGLMNEMNLDVGLGATLISQNRLSSAESFFSYGWDRKQGSLFEFGMNYNGLGVDFDLGVNYGGEQIPYTIVGKDATTGAMVFPMIPELKKHRAINFAATLPIFLQGGYYSRSFAASLGWSYTNGLVANVDQLEFDENNNPTNLRTIGFSEGLHRVAATLSYSVAARRAYRDLASPYAFSAAISYATDPWNSNFSDLFVATASGNLPGFAPNHSIRIGAGYQNTIGGYKMGESTLFGYKSSTMIPKGFTSRDINNDQFVGCSLDYALPVAYPDWGMLNLLYFKRIALNIGGDYAQYSLSYSPRQHIWSYGCDVMLDLNFLMMPAAATTTVNFSIYKPNRGTMYYNIGMSLPI